MDGRADRRTDGRTELLYQYHASVCWRAIKTRMVWLPDSENKSCAVAKRPRDASCLSVVSFVASIAQYLKCSFFIISYFSFGFTSANNSILFCCLRHNVKHCCHTCDLLWLCIVRERAWSFSRWRTTETVTLSHVALGGRIPAVYDKRYKCQLARWWPSSTGDHVDNTSRVAASTAGIYAQNRDFCIPHLHSTPPLGGFPSEYCHPVWYGKTRMVWLPTVKFFWRYLCSFWHNTRTWQTYRHRMTA